MLQKHYQQQTVPKENTLPPQMKNIYSQKNELIISRREVQYWYDSLCWLDNGVFIINTQPHLTILKTKYQHSNELNDGNNNADLPLKDMLEMDSFVLDLEGQNKFKKEVDTFGNTLLNTEVESYPRQIISGAGGYLAVITNHYNVLIYNQDFELLANLDLPPDGQPMDVASLFKFNKSRIFHCALWSSDSSFIAVGNENGEVVFFDTCGGHIETISIVEGVNIWVTHIAFSKDNMHLACGMADNSVVLHNRKSGETHQIKQQSRFALSDLKFVYKSGHSQDESVVLVTDAAQAHAYDIFSNDYSCSALQNLGYDQKTILKTNSGIYIFSCCGCVKVVIDEECKLTIQPEEKINTFLQKKIQRFNDMKNENNEYHTTMNLYGSCLSSDGSTLALIYTPELVALKYSILSSSSFKLSLIPLDECWQIEPNLSQSGGLWYQLYHAYNEALPQNYTSLLPSPQSADKCEFDIQLPFDEYLKKYVLQDNPGLKFEVFVDQEQSMNKMLLLYCHCMYAYAQAHIETITNTLDAYCVQTVTELLGKASLLNADISLKFDMKSEFITQSFDGKAPETKVQEDKWAIRSLSSLEWKRCGITFLPLVSTALRVCPVTNTRFIDLTKDSLNEYGWFTKTILKTLGDESIYANVRNI
ncbi:hypothetical protein ACO0QE_003012 [Hanseniaspora vineae]